ncbi:MAG: hypothetical protein DCC68_09515 [Planctomycetota bacterium]|nr:MAG: hypothetical protein DCC68_09515 [Planctomycetota bacterium]
MKRMAACVLVLVGAVVTLHCATVNAGEPKAKQPSPAEMIAALASKNRPPKYVDHEVLEGHKVPIFPADYDWKEYERVRVALYAIDRKMTPELWEELLKHIGDKRYSITLALTGPGLPDEDAGRDFTVGAFCEAIAYDCVGKLYARHSVSAENDTKPWERIAPTAGIRNLVEWRKQRAAKPLWQLQVEACTLALGNLARLDKATPEQKATIRKGIESEIDRLNATKKPTLLRSYICADGGVIHIDGWHEGSYNANFAGELRRRYGKSDASTQD